MLAHHLVDAGVVKARAWSSAVKNRLTGPEPRRLDPRRWAQVGHPRLRGHTGAKPSRPITVLVASRYMHEYGVTPARSCGICGVDAGPPRLTAIPAPNSMRRITVADVMASKPCGDAAQTVGFAARCSDGWRGVRDPAASRAPGFRPGGSRSAAAATGAYPSARHRDAGP